MASVGVRSSGRDRRARLVLAFVLATTSVARAEEAVRVRAPAVAEQGSLTLTVIDRRDVAKQLARLAESVSGRVVSSTDDQVVVEVPRARRAELVQKLREKYDVSGVALSSEDLSAPIADAESAVRAQKAVGERLKEIAGRGTTVAEGLVIESAREHSQDELASREGELRTLSARADVSRLTIQVVAPTPEQLPDSGQVRMPFSWIDRLGISHLMDMNTPPDELHSVLRAFVDGGMALRLDIARPHDALGSQPNAGAVGLTMRALGEADPAGLFGGCELWLGGGHGFAYNVQPMFGAGVPLGARFAFGVASGPGLDGITTVIPLGVTVPIELYLSLDLGDLAGVALWARDGWVFTASERKHGAPAAPFGDEASVGLDVAVGGFEGDSSYSRRRQGFIVGAGARQAMGSTIWEVRLGWGAHEADMSEE